MLADKICVSPAGTAKPGESAQDVADRMHVKRLSTLVVIDDKQYPVGILTDRDLVVRVVAAGLDPVRTRVSQVMTPSPVFVTEGTTWESALAKMRHGAFRRLPVVDGKDRLVGVICSDDILAGLTKEFGEFSRLLVDSRPTGATEF
jgi:CBS domain-containing protein